MFFKMNLSNIGFRGTRFKFLLTLLNLKFKKCNETRLLTFQRDLSYELMAKFNFCNKISQLSFLHLWLFLIFLFASPKNGLSAAPTAERLVFKLSRINAIFSVSKLAEELSNGFQKMFNEATKWHEIHKVGNFFESVHVYLVIISGERDHKILGHGAEDYRST